MASRPRKPLSPEAQAVLGAFGGTSRRNLMRGALAGGALLAAGGSLAACGTKPTKPSASAGPVCATPDVSATERKLVFSSWIEYLDTDENDEKKHPTLDKFTAKTGIAVTYQEDINDNNEFLG